MNKLFVRNYKFVRDMYLPVLTCVLLFVSHNSRACDDLSSVPRNYESLDYYQDIQPILMQSGCGGCHNAVGQFPDLSGANDFPLLELIGNFSVQNNEKTFIQPFRPYESYLFEKINCSAPFAGDRMPQGGFALAIEDQALIFDWIYQGAYLERLPDVIFREIIHRSDFGDGRPAK